MYGKAVSYGAVTIINAISCGFGAALGARLETQATVELTDEAGTVTGKIVSEPEENTILIEETVKQVLKRFSIENKYGAYVETKSDIPIAKGLKSSSSAANAIVLATAAALNKDLDDLESINLGVDASLRAGVTITGAFDDACASFYGGIVITDNSTRKILKNIPAEDYLLIIYVPKEKSYTASSDVDSMKLIGKEIKALHKMALSGDYWTAMTINGIIYSAALGYDVSVTLEALSCGALAAGLSGKGPAVAAVATEKEIGRIRDAWKIHEGTIIETTVNYEKAHMIRE